MFGWLRMKPFLLQTLVVHRIASTLPMEQSYYLPAFPDEDIHIPAGRVQTLAAEMLTYPVDVYTHIARMIRRHDSIFSPKLNIAFLFAKFAFKNALPKSVLFGWLRKNR